MAREDDLYDMSDEELEAAFKEAKADLGSDFSDTSDEETNDTNEDLETDEVLEDLEDDSEQLEEDSDHDTSDESEDESEEAEEESEEAEEGTPDGETSEGETETTEDETKSEDKPQKAQKLTFKANGQEYNFSEEEIKEQFPRIFGQAMDYTKKMQAIKPYRKTIDAIEQANLKHEDINLFIDVLKGDKDALSEVLKRTGIDALDLDTENSNYVAKDYGRDEQALELNDVIDSISRDAEYTVTSNIIGKQWDDASWDEMSKNPVMIKQLHVDVQSGMYDTIAPIMNKMKVFDGGRKSDLEYYKEAATVYFREQRNNTIAEEEKVKLAKQAKTDEQTRLNDIRAQEEKRKATANASAKRKAAAPTKSKVTQSKIVDYLDEDDEKFDEWYNNLQKSM